MLAIALCAAAMVSACGGRVFRARRTDSMYTFQRVEQSIISSNKPREQTMQELRLLFLDDDFKRDPSRVIAELNLLEKEAPSVELNISIAELAFLRAKQIEKKDPLAAAGYYIFAAERAYDFFLSGEKPSLSWRTDPNLRLMVNIYNVSVARLVDIWQADPAPWDKPVAIGVMGEKYLVEVGGAGKAFLNPDYFDELMPAYEVEVEGLENRYEVFGIGAPLLGVTNNIHESELVEPFRPRQIVSSVTAVLLFDTVEGDSAGARTARLFFVDPLVTEKFTVGDDEVPLEADFSTPFAFSLIEGDSGDQDLPAMFKSDQYIGRVKLIMIDRFDPEKIPVVMVHGLWSGPSTWVDMFNDLRGVPEIRRHYQFWKFRYPTGLPIIYSSTLLRRALEAARQRFDPDNKSDAFENVVLIGHSMGGLLSKMMVHQPKSNLYDLVFKVPPDELIYPEDGPEGLFNNMFFYEPLPYVRRVVFIAVPHGGSDFATQFLARLGSALISVPKYLQSPMVEFTKMNRDKFRIDPVTLNFGRVNSVDQLTPSSPFLQTIRDIPIPEKVLHHSVIGVQDSDVGPGSTDGIVPYESSHLPTAASEMLVPEGHSCLDHPFTIAEVKRILLSHLEEEGGAYDLSSLDEMEFAVDESVDEMEEGIAVELER